jgi:D-3-phosphoglycerate dehydrogenase
METYKVLVADPIAEKGIEDLRADPALDVDVKLGLSEAELVAIAGDYAGIVVRSQTQITARVLEAATKLQVVGRAGVGVDNIDTEAASRRGVVVMNTPGGNTISTAEHAFTLMMSLARRIPQAHASVAGGRFKEGRKKYQGVELNGKTLAILGMGRIGTEFAKRARAFNMRIVAYDPYLAESKATSLGVELRANLDDAVQDADFITLHLPKTDDTTHLLDAARIARMKRGVRIVNCARGGLIDEAALLAALDSGHVAGAALDVYEAEPPADGDPLLQREDVVLTPHLGASTAEAQEMVGIEIAQQIRDALVGGIIVNSVNMPNVDAQTLREVGRYIELVEAMGRLVARVSPKHPDFLRIQYSGKVSKLDTTLITRHALVGFLRVASDQNSVNPVNAPAFAETLGLRVTESRLAEPTDYTDLIEITAGNATQSSCVAGTFFGKEPRIVRLRERKINVVPKGHLLLLENTDVPGIVGSVGRVLAENQVNIANMSLGRNERGGQALMVLNLDSAPAPEVKGQLEALDGILEAKLVSL